MNPTFPTDTASILERIQKIDPIGYASSRNYVDGALTYLSPYISRGLISTSQVAEHVFSMNLPWEQIEKLIQELAWRDYWQQIWRAKGDAIFTDLKRDQENVKNHNVAEAILEAQTSIWAMDESIRHFYETGYMHNHMRMYVASIATNIAGSHWLAPSKWMYYHLLDGDLASNALSWQWVAGAFSSKKYFANQENINKYFYSDQKDSYLDVSYESFPLTEIPSSLDNTVTFNDICVLPESKGLSLIKNKKTVLYNYYNMDAQWYQDEDVQRILLLEPSLFKKHPVSSKCIDFLLALAQNIPSIQIYVGEFSELSQIIDEAYIIYKEHPLNTHYNGQQEAREWMSTVSGYYPSFFKFWKLAKKKLYR